MGNRGVVNRLGLDSSKNVSWERVANQRLSVTKSANGLGKFIFSIDGGRDGLRGVSFLFVAKSLNE